MVGVRKSSSPAACGAAIEVPLIVVVPPPFLVERMLTPGSANSIGGLPQLDYEGMQSLLSIAEIV